MRDGRRIRWGRSGPERDLWSVRGGRRVGAGLTAKEKEDVLLEGREMERGQSVRVERPRQTSVGVVERVEGERATGVEVVEHEERREVAQLHAANRPPHECSGTLDIILG